MELKTMTDIKTELRHFTGTEQYYKNFTGTRYTDGVKHLADRCGAYWLIDLISSYQPEIKNMEFQLWTIEVYEDNTARVTCQEDTDGDEVVEQVIEYTDFPFDYELWCVNGVIILKSEY